MRLAAFHLFIGHLDSFFDEMSVQIFCPFLVGLSCAFLIHLSVFFIYSGCETFVLSIWCRFLSYFVACDFTHSML